MQSKRKVVLGALVTAIALTGGYIFWPDSSAPPVGPDSSSVAAKMMDRMVAKFPIIQDTSLDTRTVINGHKVPPMPDPIENKKTVAGIDTDNNGIRDDVDRYVAENFGNDLTYDAVVREEQQLQAMLISPTKENGRLYMSELDCAVPSSLPYKQFHELSMRIDRLTKFAVNTNARGGALAMALAGANLGRCLRK